jgi:hypothetical protein
MSVSLSVYPPGTTRLPLDGCSWNLVFEYFSKTCRETSSFIKIWQEYRALCVKTPVHLWYLAQFFLEWDMVETNVVENIKTHISSSIIIFRKPYHLWYNVEKYGRARQDIDDSTIWRMCFEWWVTKATDTHSVYVILIAYPRQQWSRERASI